MSFTITFLGTSGMFQTTERACSGYLLQIDDDNVWLDSGAGTWLNLQRAIDYKDLHGVFITHAHPDHTTDLLQAYHARRYGQSVPLEPIPLWGPAEALDRLNAFAQDLDEAFDLRPITSEDQISVGKARVTFTDMAHPEQTLGVRVEYDGKVVAFSSDTGGDADFERLAGAADLFVCEATSQNSDEVWEGHLRAAQAGEIAQKVGVKRLLLTHLRPGRDHQTTLAEARATAGDVRVELAEDGSRMEIA